MCELTTKGGGNDGSCLVRADDDDTWARWVMV